MKIPSLEDANQFIIDASIKNPGPWVSHSYNVAKTAKSIADECPDMDGDAAYILGLLHDIGRYEGKTNLHHAISGYQFLIEKGYDDAARVCITHTFVVPDIRCQEGITMCSEEELDFIKQYIKNNPYNDYDKLIQLCDAIVLPEGVCLMEKRLVDVARRHGVNDFTLNKWNGFFNALDYFNNRIGKSVYSILEGVVENTFEFDR